MPRYRVLLEVSNIQIPMDDKYAIGFYATLFLNSSCIKSVSGDAKNKLITSYKFKELIGSSSNPSINIESIEEVPWYTKIFSTDLGYTFYEKN